MTQQTTWESQSPTGDESPLVDLVLERRGWSDDYLRRIESDAHDELKDVPAMIEVLERARLERRKVTIAPDFDMDGITSGVLGYAGLSELGFDVELHLPDYRRGHDLRPEDVEEIHARWPQTSVLLTCDGGVNSHEGIAAARARGWTTLVTDHHQELEPGSSADVTVNPCRMDETYAHPAICGAHVLHQVLAAYTRRYQPHKQWEIHLLRLFAGIGTVSDVMPVLFENRRVLRDSLAIARMLWAPPPQPYGPYSRPDPDGIDVSRSTLLQILSVDAHHPVYQRAFTGFALMLKAFAQVEKIRDVDDVDEGFYGFYLAPAMNAPRRTEEPLAKCFEVFTATTHEAMLEAAHEVIAGNERRKELTSHHLAELEESEQPSAPWVYLSDAPKGMLGLLASAMVARNGHPVMVLNHPARPGDPVSGSGRAPEWLGIIDTLDPHPGMTAIGHQQACGVRLESAARIDDLVEVLTEATEVALLGVAEQTRVGDLVLGPGPECDGPLEDLQALYEVADTVASLKPFGHGFLEPVVQVVLDPRDLRVRVIGSQEQHLRLTTRAGLPCLWWNAAESHHQRLLDLVQEAADRPVEPLRFTARLALNTFMDVTRVQVMIIDEL